MSLRDNQPVSAAREKQWAGLLIVLNNPSHTS